MSTLGSAGAGFGLVSRQNSVEKPIFCLLWWLRALNLTEEALFGFKSAAAAKEGLRLTKKPDKRLTH